MAMYVGVCRAIEGGKMYGNVWQRMVPCMAAYVGVWPAGVWQRMSAYAWRMAHRPLKKKKKNSLLRSMAYGGLCMAAYAGVWFTCMAMYGSVWLWRMEAYGHTWPYMAIRRHTLPYA